MLTFSPPNDEKENNESTANKEPYRYATKIDLVLLLVAITLSLTQGALNSISSIIFKDLTNALIVGQAEWDANVFDYPKFYDVIVNSHYLYLTFIILLRSFKMSCWHTVCERQVHIIRKHYLAAVLRQNMAWFDVNEVGELTTRMADGMDRVKDGSGDKLGILFACTANFIGGMAVAFSQSWKITLVMLVKLFLKSIIQHILMFINTSVKTEMSLYEKAGAAAEEAVSGARTVISCNGQKQEIERYSKRLLEAQKHGIRKGLCVALASATVFCVIFVAMAIGFWFGTKLYINGEIEPGQVFSAFWAVIGGAVAIGQAAPQLGVIMSARNAASTIFSVIDRKPEINSQSTEGKKVSSPKGNIEFKNIHFRYPSRPEIKVLEDVSFKVRPGESVALVGHSGCGKSTLVGLLLRYYNAESGSVELDGVPVEQLNVAWLRTVTGVVSQEPILFSATVAENLRLGKEDLTLEEMEKVCRMANAHNFIMELPQGYDTPIGEGGVQLSGGQKQRIAIARALARDPKILLLDEATSALDTESEQIVQHAIEKASAGRTTITIAHRLSTIRNSDNIIVFDHGKIVETGTHAQLLERKGVYLQLVKAQEIEKLKKEKDSLEEDPEEEFKNDDLFLKRYSRASSTTSVSRMSNRVKRSLTGASGSNNSIMDLKEECEENKTSPSGLLEIIRFARDEWPLLIIALGGSLAKGVVFPVFSIIYGSILTKADDADKLRGARNDAIYFTILGVCAGISTFIGGFFFSTSGEKMTRRLRLKLFSHIMKQDGEYFDSLEHASGKLTTRLATDTPNIRAAIDQRLSDVLQCISSLVSGIIIAFSYGPNMAPIGIVTAVVLMSIQTAAAQYLKIRTTQDQKLAEEPSRLSTEAIANHKTVQYLTREKYFYDKFCKQMKPVHIHTLFRGIIQALTYALHISFIFMNFACAYRFGVWLVKGRHASPYTVFQVIEALNCASMSLLAFGAYFPEYVRARFSAGLVFSMLRENPKIDGLSENGAKPPVNGDVHMKKLYFAYPTNKRHMILNGINIDALTGKTVAIVGPSGCGKSTTIQLLERFYDPIDGQIVVDNTDIRSMNISHLRSQIALVGQEPILFNISIKDNIAYGMENVSMEEIQEAAKIANAHSFITEMSEGYDTLVGEKGGKLSGGQKQRIAIARAMVRKPKILLLDEATSALDSESEKIVQEALDRARSGRTCVVIAHRLSSIQNSDLIVVMKRGTVIEQGTHQELLQSEGLYSRLIKKQNLE
uniref:ABC transporter family protein n=1 Tax=Syphacia muris TaxID=451379 RepID=A0A0N5ANT6_9BILA